MDEPITKRLHVSGLTPSITLADLSTRLGMYGSITSLDKFGEVDALGQPRKFAYVTLETTKGKLGKCASLLRLLVFLKLTTFFFLSAGSLGGHDI